ncbi:hypothetical protein Avbf_13064 [Armadillidium vulgare]|nr:hypothetical protein Avbf_13064 [Armadillidium vulgare]
MLCEFYTDLGEIVESNPGQKMKVNSAKPPTPTDGSKGNHSEFLLTFRLVKSSRIPPRPQLGRRVSLVQGLLS